MKTITQSLTCLLILTTLAGCQTMSNQDGGMIAGAAVGGLLGSRFGSGTGKALAVAGGTFAGAIIGRNIGTYMDKVDHQNVNRALESTPDGTSKQWVNPNTGYRYQVEPVRTFYEKEANTTQPCREYRTTAFIGGKKKQIYGTACRQADGSWRVASS